MEVPLQLLLLFLLALLPILIYIWSSKFFSSQHPTPPLPPGNYGWPVLGETLEARNLARSGKTDVFVKARMSRYNPNIFKTSLLGEKTLVFCGAAGHKLLFTSERSLVVTCWPQLLSKLFGDSFLTAPYEEAIKTRKVVTGFLKKELLQEFVEMFDSVCKKRLEEDWIGKEKVNSFSLVKKYAFSTVCELFAGVEDSNWQAKLLKEFNILLNGVFQLPIYFPGTRHYKAVKSAEVIRKELMRLAESKRSKQMSPQPDLISYLVDAKDEEGRQLSDKEIADNVILLIDGGHDTGSSTMMLVIKYLAESTESYQRVYEEQLKISMAKKPGELLNKDDLQKMKYSWNVVSEVLRLWPPVQGTFRKSIVDFTYAGFSIPTGWKIWWNPNSTQMNEEYFPDPHKFDPSRFEGDPPAPYVYVPFGGGTRMCPGRDFAKIEILVFLHNLVKQFRWELVFPDEKIGVDPLPVSSKGLPIYLYPHNHKRN